MERLKIDVDDIPLLISRSSMSTDVNKTGSWRIMRPFQEEKTAPCSEACPAGEDIGRIEMLTSSGLIKEACRILLMENPFPAVFGRICYHPCETVCNRKHFDEAIAVHHMERFLGDYALAEEILPEIGINRNFGKRFAIIGAGPFGLSSAYFLSHLGHQCEIYESGDHPGGLLRWGIPTYRLPADVLSGDLEKFKHLGVKIFCNRPVDEERFETIKTDYDAIIIGCGFGRTLKPNIDGEHLAWDGLEMLDTLRREKPLNALGKVAVIGGGNTAIDVARSLVRLGASPMLVYRRRRQDMPAFVQEIEMALREEVELRELLAPMEIHEQNGKKILTLQKMKVAGVGDNNRARVTPDGNKTETVKVDLVVMAIGAEPEPQWQFLYHKTHVKMNLSHCRMVKDGLPMVIGGDLINKTKSVADAIASGKQSAMALDTYFKDGWKAVERKLSACRIGNGPALSMEIYLGGERTGRTSRVVSESEINTHYFEPASQIVPTMEPLSEAKASFKEIFHTLPTDLAKAEASRCFNCGICNACDNCRIFCPESAVDLDETEKHINLDYCKGCGLCVVECPRNAMTLGEEER